MRPLPWLIQSNLQDFIQHIPLHRNWLSSSLIDTWSFSKKRICLLPAYWPGHSTAHDLGEVDLAHLSAISEGIRHHPTAGLGKSRKGLSERIALVWLQSQAESWRPETAPIVCRSWACVLWKSPLYSRSALWRSWGLEAVRSLLL
jgi:hypothetical protein